MKDSEADSVPCREIEPGGDLCRRPNKLLYAPEAFDFMEFGCNWEFIHTHLWSSLHFSLKFHVKP